MLVHVGGAQFVMILGVTMKLKLFVDNLVTDRPVNKFNLLYEAI